MTTTVITIKELAQEARRLAQVFPERVRACTYTTYKGEQLVPNCIVGEAAYNLGIPLDVLSSKNSCGIRHLAELDKPEWLDMSAEDSSPYVNWLTHLQGRQDSGNTWGEALATADRRLVMQQFSI